MKLLTKATDVPKCTGVSWGHFTMKEGLTEDLGTSSLGSCFAFAVLDKKRNQVFFAHISSDAENKWVIQHLLKPEGGRMAMFSWPVKYYAISGMDPQETTEARIEAISTYLGPSLLKRYEAKTGAVVLKHGNCLDIPTFHVVKDIDANNTPHYGDKNKIGMQSTGGLLPMPGSEFVSEI